MARLAGAARVTRGRPGRRPPRAGARARRPRRGRPARAGRRRRRDQARRRARARRGDRDLRRRRRPARRDRRRGPRRHGRDRRLLPGRRRAEVRLGEEWHHNRLDMVSSMGAWGAPHRAYPAWDRPRVMQTVVDLLAVGAVRVDAPAGPALPVRAGRRGLSVARCQPQRGGQGGAHLRRLNTRRRAVNMRRAAFASLAVLAALAVGCGGDDDEGGGGGDGGGGETLTVWNNEFQPDRMAGHPGDPRRLHREDRHQDQAGGGARGPALRR